MREGKLIFKRLFDEISFSYTSSSIQRYEFRVIGIVSIPQLRLLFLPAYQHITILLYLLISL